MTDPDRIFKQHDTWPPLDVTLSDANGPIDLTDASEVRLLMKGQKTSGAVTVDGVMTIDPDQVTNTGHVTYDWVSPDTDVVDTYQTEFQITWTGGGIETVPNGDYNSIEIIADLGP